MPSMFNNRTSTWPDPEHSIGEECLSIGDLRLWLPIGPALAAFKVLAKDLQKLLDMHKDALKQGEPLPRSIAFSMWMIGRHPQSSNPTIVFSSKSLRQRAFAKALLKDSQLLDDYPGFKIKTLERKPAIYRAGSQERGTVGITCDGTDDVEKGDPEEAIYMVDDSRGSCGALIAFGHSRLATMGGTLLINGTYYGISAQHGRYKFLDETEDAANEDNPLCFDDDSDTEDSDLENLVDITSRESISSFSEDGSSTFTFTSTTSTKDGSPGYPTGFSRTTESTLDDDPGVPSPSQPTYSSNPKISNLLPLEKNDLDYEVFELGDSSYHNPNTIDLPSSAYPSRRIIPNKVARAVVECPVWAVTGTTGCVQGTMMRQPHYIKMEGSETFQEMWAVKLDRNTKPGDSGAWVVDDAGQLFGHIVAGDPMLGLAFVIPAYKIFDDIKSRFGEEPLLCPSTSVIQRYRAPNDVKFAEQPLLDLIKGKKTFARPHICGLGGHGKSVIALRYARHVTSIGYGEEITKLKELSGIRLKQTATDWTLHERIADFLQAMVQEVQHGGEAVCRGNILGTSLILNVASNQLMPALFDALASSTKPSSCGSTVTSIDAHTYIGCNQEKHCGATDEVYNGTMDPSTTMIVGSPYLGTTHFDFTVDDFALSTYLSIPTDIDIAPASGFISDSNDDVDDDIAVASGLISNYDCALATACRSSPPTSFPAINGFSTADGFSRSLDDPIPNVSARLRGRKDPAPRCDVLACDGGGVRGLSSLFILQEVMRHIDIGLNGAIQKSAYHEARAHLRSQTGEPSCCVRCLKGSQFVQETQSVEQRIPHWPDIQRLQPMRFQTAEFDSCAGWRRHMKESESGFGIVPIHSCAGSRRRLNLLRHLNLHGHLKESESGSGIVPIREARMEMQHPHPLDQYGNQRIPHWCRWVLPDIQRLQPMRCQTIDSCDGWRRHMKEHESGSWNVPIREARMQIQELHPLDQYGNQRIPHWFTHRWVLTDIRRLEPMRVPRLDPDVYHCIFCDAKHTDPRIWLFDRYPDTRLLLSLRWNLAWWCCFFQSLCSRAIPTYDARLSRRPNSTEHTSTVTPSNQSRVHGQLNAPQRPRNNSQCSEARERERRNRILRSMALVVMGSDQNESFMRRLTELYFHFIIAGMTKDFF